MKAERKTAVCPLCSKTSHRLPQNKRHLVKDLPMGNREVSLKVKEEDLSGKPVKTILVKPDNL